MVSQWQRESGCWWALVSLCRHARNGLGTPPEMHGCLWCRHGDLPFFAISTSPRKARRENVSRDVFSCPPHDISELWFLLWTYCTVQYAGHVGYCSLCSAYLVILELCNLPRVDLIFTCLPWADLMDSPFSTPYLLASLHADTVWLNLFCRRQKAKEKALRKMKKLMAKSGPALSDKITRWSESVLCDPCFC